MQAQVLDHLPTVFHRVALSNLSHDSCIEPLHLKVNRPDHKVIAWHQLPLLFGMKLRVDRPLDFLQHDSTRGDVKPYLKDTIRHLDVLYVAERRWTEHSFGAVELNLLVGEGPLRELETKAILRQVLLDSVTIFHAKVLDYLFCLCDLLLGQELPDVALVRLKEFFERLRA